MKSWGSTEGGIRQRSGNKGIGWKLIYETVSLQDAHAQSCIKMMSSVASKECAFYESELEEQRNQRHIAEWRTGMCSVGMNINLKPANWVKCDSHSFLLAYGMNVGLYANRQETVGNFSQKDLKIPTEHTFTYFPDYLAFTEAHHLISPDHGLYMVSKHY